MPLCSDPNVIETGVTLPGQCSLTWNKTTSKSLCLSLRGSKVAQTLQVGDTEDWISLPILLLTCCYSRFQAEPKIHPLTRALRTYSGLSWAKDWPWYNNLILDRQFGGAPIFPNFSGYCSKKPIGWNTIKPNTKNRQFKVLERTTEIETMIHKNLSIVEFAFRIFYLFKKNSRPDQKITMKEFILVYGRCKKKKNLRMHQVNGFIEMNAPSS